MSDCLVNLSQVSFSRAHRLILKDVDCAIQAGEIVAVIGNNGSGKTTLLSLIAGELLPNAGKIVYRNNLSVGFVDEQSKLYPEWQVGEFLLWCATLRGCQHTKDAVKKVMDDCQLASVLQERIANLSQGYRQRLQLAQALVHRPQLLLLDEPSNGLDPKQRLIIREILHNVRREGSAIVMIHHDLEEVIALADSVYDVHAQTVKKVALPQKGQWVWTHWQDKITIACDWQYGQFSGEFCQQDSQKQKTIFARRAESSDVLSVSTVFPAPAMLAMMEAIRE